MGGHALVVRPSAGRRQPIWLAPAGRWATLTRRRARLMLAIAAALTLAAAALSHGQAADPINGSIDAALVDGVRHGGDYHAVAADAFRSAGVALSARLASLPTLFVIQGRAPAFLASGAAMLLAAAVLVGWKARFGLLLTSRRAGLIALTLMLAGVAIVLRPPLVAVPEGWAGLLVALSLARRAPGRLVEPVALGLAAAMLTSAALPYAAVMSLAAWRERARLEALAWGAVLPAGAAALALHAHVLAAIAPAVSTATTPLDPGAALAALGWATGLRVLPVALASAGTVLATLGWASRREPPASRVAALIVVQTGLVAFLATPNAALVVAPLLPLGLLALPDAARELFAAALDRRRVTVTRLVR